MSERNMPRIWADKVDGGVWCETETGGNYIRSDIAERLAEALEQIIRYCDGSTDPVIANTAKAALSAFKAAQSEASHG